MLANLSGVASLTQKQFTHAMSLYVLFCLTIGQEHGHSSVFWHNSVYWHSSIRWHSIIHWHNNIRSPSTLNVITSIITSETRRTLRSIQKFCVVIGCSLLIHCTPWQSCFLFAPSTSLRCSLLIPCGSAALCSLHLTIFATLPSLALSEILNLLCEVSFVVIILFYCTDLQIWRHGETHRDICGSNMF